MNEPRPRQSGVIEVKLKGILQLFNSMDPSPFPDRDLDADAEEFIVGWAMEHPRHVPLTLVVHLSSPPTETEDSVRTAVNHYFAYRADVMSREFRLLMRQGRWALQIGIVFLAICLVTARMTALRWPGTAGSLLQESLTIGGWVAMWRPIEIYLYGWWPLLQRRRVYEKLARMPVRLSYFADSDAERVSHP